MDFIIPRYRADDVIEAWKELCKKAKRLRCTPPPEPTFKDIKHRGEVTAKVKVTIADKRIALPGGWKLVAKVDFAGGRPVTSVLPGFEFRFTRRKDKNGCDHCHHKRNRNVCYIVENTKGTRKQIGSKCVKDFLGHDPSQIIKHSDLVIELLDGFSEERWGSGIPPYETLENYLTHVAAAIRLQGYRSHARFDYPTSDQAYEWMTDHKDALNWQAAVKPVLKDSAKIAKAAIAFAKRIKPDSSFLDNLKNIAINGAFLFNQKGFAAYIVQHYLTNKPDDSPDNGYFGTVGERKKTIVAKVEGVHGFSGAYGDGRIVKFRTVQDSKLLTWFCTASVDIVPGKEYTFSATIKSHEQFRGTSQTIVTRCKLVAAA